MYFSGLILYNVLKSKETENLLPQIQFKMKEDNIMSTRKNFGAKPFLFPQPVLIIGTYDGNGKANAMNAVCQRSDYQ